MSRFVWTLELIIQDALKSPTRKQWAIRSNGAYRAARRMHVLDECCAHMPELHHNWTIAELQADALRYQHRTEWYTQSRNAYAVARKRGILDECCAHMQSKYITWNIELLNKQALLYNSRAEWQYKHPSSYVVACSRGIIDECCAHMNRSRGSSSDEINLLKKIQERFPKAQRIFFGKKKRGQAGQCFELDIYIPELRKGIEFNGTYYHSPAGLRRSRPRWSEDMIQHYHELKKAFFENRGITIFNVQESDWRDNQEATLAKVFRFLNE